MKQQAILDFTDDGKAVVQIPDVGEVAFINMFGLSTTSEVERDIEVADTPERKAFLAEYLNAYHQIFGGDAELSQKTKDTLERFEDAMIDKLPIFETRELDCYDLTDEDYDEAWNIVADEDSEELDNAMENSYIREISVNVYKMKHSTAWYLFGHVKADIEAALKQIECMKGLPKVIDNIDAVCGIIRKAADTRDATEKLTEEFGLTKDQAAYAVGFHLTELAGIKKDNVQDNIEDYEKILALLKRLDK